VRSRFRIITDCILNGSEPQAAVAAGAQGLSQPAVQNFISALLVPQDVAASVVVEFNVRMTDIRGLPPELRHDAFKERIGSDWIEFTRNVSHWLNDTKSALWYVLPQDFKAELAVLLRPEWERLCRERDAALVELPK
jgi:hypothetical protein